ncbi:hypothetical protein NTGM5_30057 [Candidatus Nitrotoga sp. M5]|nr:hypothetical protein NTGM5_30057 [Candidatus Nitrotoga sp. M5]
MLYAVHSCLSDGAHKLPTHSKKDSQVFPSQDSLDHQSILLLLILTGNLKTYIKNSICLVCRVT